MQITNSPMHFKANMPEPIAPAIDYNNHQTPPMPQEEVADDYFMLQAREQNKLEKREQNRDKWNKAGVIAQAAIALGFILSAFATVKGAKINAEAIKKANKGNNTKVLDTLKPVDVSKERTFEELTLGKEMQKVVDDMKTRLERSDALKKKGSNGGNGIMLYGEPGGGKNAYVYAYTKYLQEKFPGAELYEMNVLKLQDKWLGETENNIMGFVEKFQKIAQDNPDKKIVVFMDEFDSIARKASDGNSNKEVRESFQNAFKTTLTKLTAMDNVQVIAATNKAEKDAALNTMLDDAILNRFPQKIYVPLPTKDQIKQAIISHYKSLPSDVVSKELTSKNSSKLDNICKDIAKKSNHASFRDLQYIFEHARVISESGKRKEGSPITIEDLKAAVKKHAEAENWNKKGDKTTENKTKFSDLPFIQKLILLFHK